MPFTPAAAAAAAAADDDDEKADGRFFTALARSIITMLRGVAVSVPVIFLLSETDHRSEDPLWIVRHRRNRPDRNSAARLIQTVMRRWAVEWRILIISPPLSLSEAASVYNVVLRAAD